MMYIKKYENRFTNIFKSSGNMFQDYMDDYIGSKFGKNFNALMGAAKEGNWKRFKYLLPKYKKYINDIYTDMTNNRETKENVLFLVINGDGDIWEKKKMISTLINYGIDLNFVNEDGKNFYEMITDPKLKKWIDETYPNIESELKANKYNL